MQRLISFLKNHHEICLVTHVNPDGDALGSLHGLAYGLQELGVSVRVIIPTPIPPSFLLLEKDRHGLSIDTNLDFRDGEGLICLDCPDAVRTGYREAVLAYSRAGHLAYIDHHPTGDLARMTSTSLHKTTTSSTCELVFDLMQEFGLKFTPRISTALLLGIYTDTGAFKHDNCSARTLQVVSELLRRGASLATIVRSIQQSRTIPHLKLLGISLERLQLGYGGIVGFSVLCGDDITTVNAAPSDLQGIVSAIEQLPETRLTVFLREEADGTIHGSLRSSSQKGSWHVPCDRLARLLGGNGHPRAAGFLIPGKLQKNSSGYWQII
jgi:bifunctional oligoribonuclease and PAP phosphatase NrnA